MYTQPENILHKETEICKYWYNLFILFFNFIHVIDTDSLYPAKKRIINI